MTTDSQPTGPPPPEIGLPGSLANRYRYISPLGRGGMAIVFLVEAIDSGRRLALKRLLPCEEPNRAARAQELFEREYLTLAQLSHPCIVRAHDFDVSDGVSFYTMDFLEGGDLDGAGVQPWRTVCQIGRELCSALSLLHSRRWVFRDLSPNNILFSTTGRATLIDFGAMAEMGKAHTPVCTPAVAAPELLQSQPIDGRADLFALGASLYFALTGRHAFPARKFSQLVTLWQNPPRPPSHYVHDIPGALDRLVLDLLQPEVEMRPSNAGEVAEQLCIIGNLSEDAPLQRCTAYLTTPRLVGRSRALAILRQRMQRLGATHEGHSVLITGPAGVGRTRLLDAAYLEARIQGLSTIRGSAASAYAGRLGAVRAMSHQLLNSNPEAAVAAAAPNWRVLSELIPQLSAHQSLIPESYSEEADTLAAPALRAWICRLVAIRPAAIFVDDVHRLDPESQALLALLANDAPHHPYLLVTSLLDGPDQDALTILRRCSTVQVLGALPLEGSKKLLASIFGDVPNLPYVVNRLHQITNGNPQGLMRIAQHMLNLGICERRDGGWVLPEFVDSKQIPEDMTAALAAVAATLEPSSRSLACKLSLCENLTLSLSECCQLMEPAPRAEVLSLIDKLIAASVLELDNGNVCLAGQAWRAALPLPDDAVEETHRRVAALFSARGEGIRAARHYISGGLLSRAVETLVAFSEATLQATDSDPSAYVKLLVSVPSDWPAVFRRTIELALEHDSSDHALFVLHSRMIGLASPTVTPVNAELDWLGTRLTEDCGLDLLARLPPETPPEKRLPTVLEQAAARNSAKPVNRQLFAPSEAIPALCRTMIAAISNFSNNLDVDAWNRMPSLSDLAPLSPAIALIDKLALGFDARIKGRLGYAREIYTDIVQALDQGQALGTLEATYADTMKSGVAVIVGLMDAALGLPSWEQWHLIVAKQQLHEASCLSIHAVRELWQGNSKQSEVIEQQRMLRKLEQPLPQAFESVALVWRAAGYSIIGDVARLGEQRTAITALVERSPAWRPVLHWIQGEYAAAIGHYREALSEQKAALELMDAAEHVVWAWAAASLVRAQLLVGDPEGAADVGQRLAATALRKQLGYPIIYIHMALAEAQAACGDAQGSRRLIKEGANMIEAMGASGLLLGLVHESATKVALALLDREAFDHHFTSCQRVYEMHKNRVLRDRFKRLSTESKRVWPTNPDPGDGQISLVPTVGGTTEWLSELESAGTRESRVAYALNLVVSECHGASACFLGWGEEETVVLGEVGNFKADSKAAETFQTLLREAIEPMVTSTGDMAEELDSEQLQFGEHSFHAELVQHETPKGTIVSGLLVLELAPDSNITRLPRLTPILSRVLTDSESLTVMTVSE